MVVLFVIFWGLSILFPKWLHQIIVPTTVYKRSLFSASSPTLISDCLLDNSHSNRYEVISHCDFDFHFPDDCLRTFSCIHWQLYIFFGKKGLFSSSAHFLMRLGFFFLLLLRYMCSSYTLDINPLSNNMIYKYFLLFGRLPLCFVGGFLCYATTS